MTTPETESLDVCPVCENLRPDDVEKLVFELADGEVFEVKPTGVRQGDLLCQMLQSIDAKSVHARRFDGTRTRSAAIDFTRIPIGRVIRPMTIASKCIACGGTGTASHAMRRLIEGRWTRKT